VDCDDIIIGSGLTALATVIGLASERRIVVLCGPRTPVTHYYEGSQAIPREHLGLGGLGNFWHGVIPTGNRADPNATDAGEFVRLFDRFYPRADVASRLGKPWLFVPWRPIRPQAHWQHLERERGTRLRLVLAAAQRFAIDSRGVQVWTNDARLSARRLWVCAGALQTPGLLDRSLERPVSRTTVSDHVLCYIGQIDRASHSKVPAPRAERTRAGVWFEAHYNEALTALFTLRPARFAYRRLDYGIEQRAVFGLPTGSAVAKIVRGASAGLVAEALYNRAGLFAGARFQSVYAQILVPDAYWLRAGAAPAVRADVVRQATDAVRADRVWSGVETSRRPELFLPIIHLHHSVDRQALGATGIDEPGSPVRIVDASVRERIGPEHHSFRMMVSAFARARGS
jgi:hypothetical protein